LGQISVAYGKKLKSRDLKNRSGFMHRLDENALQLEVPMLQREQSIDEQPFN